MIHDLSARLTALAEPAPPMPAGAVAAIRGRAARQRRRRATLAAVALLLVLAGGASFARSHLPTDGSAGVTVAGQPTGLLLGWPTRGETQIGIDVNVVAAAWDSADGRAHRSVRLLYTGMAGPVGVVVAEGIDSTGAARIAILTTGDKAGTPRPPAPAPAVEVSADIAGFSADPPDYLLISVEGDNGSRKVLVLIAPGAKRGQLLAADATVLTSLDPASGVAWADVTPADGPGLFVLADRARRPLAPVPSAAPTTVQVFRA
jgi:hypothetical protein